jgi:hypothetical protein
MCVLVYIIDMFIFSVDISLGINQQTTDIEISIRNGEVQG